MAIIIPFQKRKRQKYLILALVSAVLLILIIVIIGISSKPETEKLKEVSVQKPVLIEIDFGVLESQALKELQPFEEILPFEGQVGRENPFIPY